MAAGTAIRKLSSSHTTRTNAGTAVRKLSPGHTTGANPGAAAGKHTPGHTTGTNAGATIRTGRDGRRAPGAERVCAPCDGAAAGGEGGSRRTGSASAEGSRCAGTEPCKASHTEEASHTGEASLTGDASRTGEASRSTAACRAKPGSTNSTARRRTYAAAVLRVKRNVPTAAAQDRLERHPQAAEAELVSVQQ